MATPGRNIRIDDQLWQAAKDKAWHERTSVNAAVTAFLRDWTATNPPADPATTRSPAPARTRRTTPPAQQAAPCAHKGLKPGAWCREGQHIVA
jgi:hypothetical protein